jgi:hypothetical protein
MTLHWDGDVILFITDASGNVVDFKAGLDGEITPRDPNQSALVTYERDSASLIIGSSVNGTTSLAPLDAWDGTGPNFGPSYYAQYVRPDGFQIAGLRRRANPRDPDQRRARIRSRARQLDDAGRFRRRHPRPGFAAEVHVESWQSGRL